MNRIRKHDDQAVVSREQLHDLVAEALQQVQNVDDGESIEELSELKKRLDDPRKWVAVFGAFSAGKSSLINALLEDNPLAVSPHPTTATITQIEAVRGGQEAVVVHAKTESQMWEDVQRALSHVHLEVDSLEAAVSTSKQLRAADFPSSARRHVGFLKAVAAGYSEMRDRMGTAWNCGSDELEALTAKEAVACYVDRVELQHAASILKDGLVLIDTPGVDSIHRRHTDVAFDFMRRADAVLFVLYYSHAFARADQAFLTQLAQVQDIVGVNKLFVVINAVDLASDEQERQAVVDRVHKELRALGIARPRVYEVSSQLAFAASQMLRRGPSESLENLIRQRLRLSESEFLPDADVIGLHSGISDLRKELLSFLNEQSLALAESAIATQFQSVRQRLTSRLARGRRQQSENDAEKARREGLQSALATELEATLELIQSGQSAEERAMQSEWDELLFHAGERVRLSFNGNFRSTFHPGQFRAKGNPRSVLQAAATELVEAVDRQLEAETRTFGLRAEAHVRSALGRAAARLLDQIANAEVEVFPIDPLLGLPAVDVLPRRADIDWRIIQPYFKHFVSPQQYFEGGGQTAMRREAEPKMMDAAQQELTAMSAPVVESWLQVYRQQLSNLLSNTAQILRGQVVTQTVDASIMLQYEQVVSWFTDCLQVATTV